MDVNARPTTFLIGIPRVIKDVIVEHVMARDLEECLRKCI
jgi:predicted ATP-grasp superfamily ATP-dependent carboligase